MICFRVLRPSAAPVTRPIAPRARSEPRRRRGPGGRRRWMHTKSRWHRSPRGASHVTDNACLVSLLPPAPQSSLSSFLSATPPHTSSIPSPRSRSSTAQRLHTTTRPLLARRRPLPGREARDAQSRSVAAARVAGAERETVVVAVPVLGGRRESTPRRRAATVSFLGPLTWGRRRRR